MGMSHQQRRQGCGYLNWSDWWRSVGCWTAPGMSEAAEELHLLKDTQDGLVSQTKQEQRVSQSENV